MNKGLLLEQDGLTVKQRPIPIHEIEPKRIPYKGPETQPFKRFVEEKKGQKELDRLKRAIPKGRKRHDLFLTAPDGREYAFTVKDDTNWFDRLIPPKLYTEYGTYGTNRCNTLQAPSVTMPTWYNYFWDCQLSNTMDKFTLLQEKDKKGVWLLPSALVYKGTIQGNDSVKTFVKTWKIQVVAIIRHDLKGKLPKIDKAPVYRAKSEPTPNELDRAIRTADRLCPIPPKQETEPICKTYEWGHRKHNGTKDVIIVCRH